MRPQNSFNSNRMLFSYVFNIWLIVRRYGIVCGEIGFQIIVRIVSDFLLSHRDLFVFHFNLCVLILIT